MGRRAGAGTRTVKLLGASADGVGHQQARAEKRGTQLAAMVVAGGFTRPEGWVEMIGYVDEACMCVLMARNVSDGEFG